MKERILAKKLLEYARAFPIVTLTGPRQSGKTTLCKALFRDLPYQSLEEPDVRMAARTDPRGFLRRFADSGCVLDEVQRVPDILSYLQGMADADPRPGRFILTGSQNFALLEAVTQSMAGRTALATLLPFTMREAYDEGDEPPLWEMVWRGFFPRVLTSPASPTDTLSFYVQTYLERDVRSLVNVGDFSRFEAFLRLCAGRTARLLNLSDLAADAGVALNTAKSWLSVLEAGYVVRRLRPWSGNLGKRISKTPKLYFLDTGLACNLLGIESAKQLETHPLRGELFETFVVCELWKRRAAAGGRDNLFFYRDAKKREIDVVEETADGLDLCEIKSGATFSPDWLAPLEKIAAELPRVRSSTLVHGSDVVGPPPELHGARILGWRQF